MPQTNIAIPKCKNQIAFGNYLASWTTDDLGNAEIKNESPPESKLAVQNTGHFDENLSCQVRENDSCDSGFGPGSDEEDRFNSGLSSADDSDPKIVLKPGSVLETTDLFDFWNITTVKENYIDNRCTEEQADKSSIFNLTSNCDDHDNQAAFSDDVGSFLDLLSRSIGEKCSESESKKFSEVDSCHVSKQETVNSESDLNFYESFDISNEKNNKMVHSVAFQNNLLNGETSNYVSSLSFKCSNSLNNSPNFDNTYSDFFTSLCLDSSCTDDSIQLNSAPNNEVNNLISDELTNSSKCSENLILPETDESLSDLLASICVESNIFGKNKDSLPEKTGLMKEKSCDIDNNEISLASLAEEYLSSGTSKFFLSTSEKDNFIDLSENILNLEKASETNLNPLNKDDCQDLFAVLNKKSDNPDTICFNNSNDLLLKSDSDNIRSQTLYSRNENAVASFAEKYIHNDESSDDETDFNLEIDLTSCLKSDILPSSSSQSISITSDRIIQENISDPLHVHSSPTMLMKSSKEIYSPLLKSKTTNSKQSLFAKALSCKPKKDKSAVLKVLGVQKQFCERLFNPTQQAYTIKPIKPVVCPANDFIYSTLGRRIFERGTAQEVK